MTDSDTINGALAAAVLARPTNEALVDPPNRAAVMWGEPRRLTWAAVDAAVDAIGADLVDAGVGPGNRVGIQLPNVVELPLTILACLRLGAVAVPFPVQHRAHELGFGFSAAEVTVMVTGPRHDRPDADEEIAQASAAAGHPVRIVGVEPAGAPHRLDLDSGRSPATGHLARPDDVATVCWTSGTTGTPKGVPRRHRMWLASGAFQVSQLGLGPDDRLLCPFPVVNMAGIGGMLVPWVMTGAALHLHHPLDLGVFLTQMHQEQITYTVAPPALLSRLLAEPAILEGIDLGAVRAISSGAAPLDPDMVAGWQERGIEIVNVFGSNEGAALLSTATTVADPRLRARYFPRPDREGVETRLVDLDSGVDIEEPDRPGELRFRGATVFDGYLSSDGAEFDDQGFYRTGDLFEWVADNNEPRLLRFVDRAKDIVIRGGMNVSAAEVEGLLSDHPAVLESAVVGYPDPHLGERVGAYVVVNGADQPSLDDLVTHLRAHRVASYKLPERLELVEALPRNATGKVTKEVLRDRWRAPEADPS